MMVGLVGYILEDQIENMLVKTFDELIAQYKNDSVATNAIDALQNEVKFLMHIRIYSNVK